MKINSEYSNTNLFEIAKKREAEEQSKSEPKTFKNQNPVQVDISKEAMDKYRAEFQENASAESDETVHWLNTEDYTMKCVRINGKDEKRENLEYQPEHFSENIIKAGATFRSMFLNGKQAGNSSIQDILSKISLW